MSKLLDRALALNKLISESFERHKTLAASHSILGSPPPDAEAEAEHERFCDLWDERAELLRKLDGAQWQKYLTLIRQPTEKT